MQDLKIEDFNRKYSLTAMIGLSGSNYKLVLFDSDHSRNNISSVNEADRLMSIYLEVRNSIKAIEQSFMEINEGKSIYTETITNGLAPGYQAIYYIQDGVINVTGYTYRQNNEITYSLWEFFVRHGDKIKELQPVWDNFLEVKEWFS